MEKPKRADGFKENLSKISAWGCVAFAARSAQRVLPLCCGYLKSIGEPLTDSLRSITAIALEAAETGGSVFSDEELTKASASLERFKTVLSKQEKTIKLHSIEYYSFAAAHQALAAVDAVVKTTHHAVRNKSDYSSHAATAATFSESASAAGAQAEARSKVGSSADNSILMAGQGGSVSIRNEMWRDIETLFELAGAKHIPIRVLGTLWESSPPLWASQIATSREASLEPLDNLEIYIDAGEASTEVIQKVFEALSKLHIALGGTGLEFHADGDFVCIRERANA